MPAGVLSSDSLGLHTPVGQIQRDVDSHAIEGGDLAVRLWVSSLLAPVVLLGVCACGGAGSTPPPPGPSVGQQLHAELPASVRMASLRDSSGRRVSLESLRGKVVVLSDLLTLCQETCPLDTANVVAAGRKVEASGLGKRVVFLSVTVDPQRDTQHRLAAYRRLYNPAPHDWLTLTGSPATLHTFWKRLGVFVKRVPDKPPAPHDWLTGKPLHYDVTHSDAVFFLDQSGRLRFLLTGSPHVAAGAPIPPELRRLLNDKGHRNLTHPDARAWTLQQELSVISWLVGHRV